MKPYAVSTILATVALFAVSASADDTEQCLDAVSKGQKFRDGHQLVDAREQFRVCARASCPRVIQTDCATWLDAVERALPTVVLSAKDAAGNDVFDVRVSADGSPLATRLDGVAIPVNPGPHAFRFERGQTFVDLRVLVQEGQKAIPVSVTLASPTSPIGGAEAPSSSAAPVPPQQAPAGEATSGSGLHTAGWILGATGLAGVGVGSAFGIVAVSKKNAAQCDSAGACTNFGSVNDAKNAATIANVGLIAGGVLLAGGAALLWLTRGDADRSATTASVHAAPLVGPQGGGLLLECGW